MQNILLVLAVLACVGQSRRVHENEINARYGANEQHVLSSLLLARTPPAIKTHSKSVVRSTAMDPRRAASAGTLITALSLTPQAAWAVKAVNYPATLFPLAVGAGFALILVYFAVLFGTGKLFDLAWGEPETDEPENEFGPDVTAKFSAGKSKVRGFADGATTEFVMEDNLNEAIRELTDQAFIADTSEEDFSLAKEKVQAALQM